MQCECSQCNKLAIITIMTNHATPIPDQFVCLTGMKHSSTAAYCLSNPTGLTVAIGGRSKCHAKEHSETHRRNHRRRGDRRCIQSSSFTANHLTAGA